MPPFEAQQSAFPHPPGVRRVPLPDGGRPGEFYMETTPDSRGMSLRDYFAGQALIALAWHLSPHLGDGSVRVVAGSAYQVADAMMAERVRDDPRG